MSTGNKKVYRKVKKNTEKDKRMAQLEKEIARLEIENSKLKRDSVGYESRLASFGGAATRFATDFSPLNRDLHAIVNKRATQKPEDTFSGASHSKNVSSDASRKKKLHTKLIKTIKKKDTKK